MAELARCGNCGKVRPVVELVEAKDLHERVVEGGPIPSGECPDCGALAYPADALDELAAGVGYSDGADGGDESGVDALIDYKNALEDRCHSQEADLERTEAALTQIQHVTHDGLVKVEEGTTWYVRYHHATEIIQKAQSIAEGQRADPEFVAMLKAAQDED